MSESQDSVSSLLYKQRIEKDSFMLMFLIARAVLQKSQFVTG